MRKILMLACMGLFGSASAAQPPVVVEGSSAPVRFVSYGDLNLMTEGGRDWLKRRIRAAAHDICFENNVEPLEIAMARRQCYKTAISSGFQQMNAAIAANDGGTTLAIATLIVHGD